MKNTTNKTTIQRLCDDNRYLTSITQYEIENIQTLDVAEFTFKNGNKEFTICVTTKNGDSISFTADQFAKRTPEMQEKRYEEMTDGEKELLNTANRKNLIID